MAFYELDEVFGYQDANRIKRLWADIAAPENPGEGEVWLDISLSPFQLKRYNGSSWDIIGESTATDILEKLKQVDGTGSGLDADKLDGKEGSFYQDASNLNAGTVPSARLSAADLLTLLKTVDGGVSGLDADKLDGNEGSFYQNASNLNSGTVPQARLSAAILLTLLKTVTGSGSGLDADKLDGYEGSFYRNASYLNTGTVPQDRLSAAILLTLLKTVDGSSSGLDADKLDGYEGSVYRNASYLNAGTVPQARLSAATLLTLLKTVDGGGCGLDADKLDGLDAFAFIRSNANDTFSGTLTSSETSGAVIKFDNGDSMITVHDGYGNFNIKSGVDENHNIINSNGGSHIELSETGDITASVSDNTVGQTFTDDTYVKITNTGVDVDATQFRVLKSGVEKLKVGTDGKIYEGPTKLEDKYIMRDDLIFDRYVNVQLSRAHEDPTTVLNVTGRGAAQISFGGPGIDDPYGYIKSLVVTVDGNIVCNGPQTAGTSLLYHFNTSIKIVAKASPVGTYCSVSYCLN